jgi:uncharacterized surface anchored protein
MRSPANDRARPSDGTTTEHTTEHSEARTPATGSLPFTGENVLTLILIGLLLTCVGLALAALFTTPSTEPRLSELEGNSALEEAHK